MTDKDLTHIYLVVDRSGSIAQCLADMQGGLNTFINDQAKQPGKCKVSYLRFDTEFDQVFWDKDISEVGKLTIEPRGMTALLDAIGKTINEAGDRLAKLPEDQRPGSVIVAIVTDGLENSSEEFDWEMVKKMIERQENQYQWFFQYLGANQDAVMVGSKMGIARGQTMTFDPANAGAAYAAMSTNTSRYRGATASGLSHTEATKVASFTEKERKGATGGKNS